MKNNQFLIATILIIFSSIGMSEPPIKFDCDPPRRVNFGEVQITITHCIDSLGPDDDGMYSFHYDYETLTFEMGNESLSGK